MTPLQLRILEVVRTIPRGKVVSYGQVAIALGIPRAARLVGQAMSKMEDVDDFPWWRVLNNQGIISIKGNQFATKATQKQLLEAEGVEVSDDFTLQINKYRFPL
jgi:methylated-DNA-protein-cysteine methyltransferase related protein